MWRLFVFVGEIWVPPPHIQRLEESGCCPSLGRLAKSPPPWQMTKCGCPPVMFYEKSLISYFLNIQPTSINNDGLQVYSFKCSSITPTNTYPQQISKSYLLHDVHYMNVPKIGLDIQIILFRVVNVCIQLN